MEEEKTKILSCFIIMPFTKVEEKKAGKTILQRELNEDDLTHIYNKFFVKALRSFNDTGYKISNPKRNSNKTGSFVKSIVSSLHQADIVLADLTGMNPNVMYELGIRHTLKNKTLLVTQNKKSLPSDLQTYIALEYEYPEEPHKIDNAYKKFERELHEAIKESLGNGDNPDNPVTDFLGIKQVFKDEEKIKKLESVLNLYRTVRFDFLNALCKIFLRLKDWRKGKRTLYLHFSTQLYESFLIEFLKINPPKFYFFLKFFFDGLYFMLHPKNQEMFFKKLINEKVPVNEILEPYSQIPLVDSLEPPNKTIDLLDYVKFEDSESIEESIKRFWEDSNIDRFEKYIEKQITKLKK